MSLKKSLLSVAATQEGYFTAQQAKNAGYTPYHHGYHVSVGNWEKVDRGVFRIPGYPNNLQSDFVKWSLILIGRSQLLEISVFDLTRY